MDDHFESSDMYAIIIGRDLPGKLSMIIKFNDKVVTWDTDTIPRKDRATILTSESPLEILQV